MATTNVVSSSPRWSRSSSNVLKDMSSWGTLISDGVAAMETYPWMLIYPSLTLMLTLLALNFFGDGLREALDPKASKD